MKYRRLGNTNISVSEIGFGAWGISGEKPNLKAYGPKDDRTSLLALDTALDKGITFYDTASSYGAGHSENLIGKAFRFKRNKIVIATKGGYLNTFNPNGLNQDFSPQGIQKSLEESLVRLKTNYIDLYQIHDCPLSKMNEDTFNLLIKLKSKGILRSIGFAGKSPDDTLKILDNYKFDVIQVNFNLTDMRCICNGLFKKCYDSNIGIIVRTPLVFGYLTGEINDETIFHHSDHRSRFSKEQIKKWLSVWDFYHDSLNFCKHYTKTQKALCFCLSFNEVSVINVGMSNKNHVIENIYNISLDKFSNEHLTKCINDYNRNYSNMVLPK